MSTPVEPRGRRAPRTRSDAVASLASAAVGPAGRAVPQPSAAPLVGLAPVIAPHTRLVVLGSFPGVTSLREQRYYGHPRNHFWPILSALWHVDLVAMPYADRLPVVLDHHLGIWDVYANCRREGSLDSAIEDAVPNDLSSLVAHAPALEAIAHNGGESARAMRVTRALGVEVHRLPSTSPANASWSFERKLAAWRAVFERHGIAGSGPASGPGSESGQRTTSDRLTAP